MSADTLNINLDSLIEVKTNLETYLSNQEPLLEKLTKKIESVNNEWKDEDYDNLVQVLNQINSKFNNEFLEINKLINVINEKLAMIQELSQIKIK